LILKENKLLRDEVKRLSQENATLKEASRENIELRQALGLRRSMPLQMLPAEVISRKASVWFDTAMIDKGSRSGVVKSAAVVNFRGLIGQIVESDLFTSQMVALTDPSSAVGAIVQRSRSSGIIQGQGADYLVLAYLPKDADIKEKDVIVSSGMGRVIPKGFPIGRVIRVKRNSLAGTTSALVRPSVRLDQVEQVFVVKPGQSITSAGSQQ
jgi:rod shape-determining protein MreC